MDKVPIVTVVVPTRDRPDMLGRTLASIRAQSLRDFEALVVDDGSGPAALEAYERIFHDLDERFRFLPLGAIAGAPVGHEAFVSVAAEILSGVPHGPGAARNRGILAAQSEFVAFCDDDDWYRLEDHLEVGVRALRERGAGFYFTNARGMSGDRVAIEDFFWGCPALAEGPGVREIPPKVLSEVIGRYAIPCIDSWIVRRSLFDRAGIFDERIPYAEDFHLVMRLLDAAGGALYRGAGAIAVHVAPRDSVTSRFTPVAMYRSAAAAAQDLLRLVSDPALRLAVRRTLAWNLGLVAERELADGLRAPSLANAWRALRALPSPGRLAHFARIAFGAAIGRTRLTKNAGELAAARSEAAAMAAAALAASRAPVTADAGGPGGAGGPVASAASGSSGKAAVGASGTEAGRAASKEAGGETGPDAGEAGEAAGAAARDRARRPRRPRR